MLVYSCGTEVVTKSSKLSAIITAINIRFNKIIYEISYFYNGEYRSAWINEEEFVLASTISKKTISYK